jgi:hypothetical protein
MVRIATAAQERQLADMMTNIGLRMEAERRLARGKQQA